MAPSSEDAAGLKSRIGALIKMSQPFDNRDYDVRKLAAKDAEIERLKEENWGYLEVAQKLKWAVETSASKDAEIERLKAESAHWQDMGCQADVACMGLSAEVERLKEQNEVDYKITVGVCNENTDLKKLVTELADALSHYALLNSFEKSLLERAGEVTK